MALPLRNDLPTASGLSSVLTSSATRLGGEADASHSFEPGGQVARLHADLAARLASSIAGAAVAPDPKERLVRLVSVAGGYLALAAAYAGFVLLLLH